MLHHPPMGRCAVTLPLYTTTGQRPRSRPLLYRMSNVTVSSRAAKRERRLVPRSHSRARVPADIEPFPRNRRGRGGHRCLRDLHTIDDEHTPALAPPRSFELEHELAVALGKDRRRNELGPLPRAVQSVVQAAVVHVEGEAGVAIAEGHENASRRASCRPVPVSMLPPLSDVTMNSVLSSSPIRSR